MGGGVEGGGGRYLYYIYRNICTGNHKQGNVDWTAKHSQTRTHVTEGEQTPCQATIITNTQNIFFSLQFIYTKLYPLGNQAKFLPSRPRQLHFAQMMCFLPAVNSVGSSLSLPDTPEQDTQTVEDTRGPWSAAQHNSKIIDRQHDPILRIKTFANVSICLRIYSCN